MRSDEYTSLKTRTNTHTHTNSLSFSHKHTLSRKHTNKHSHTMSHTLTRAHTHSHECMIWSWRGGEIYMLMPFLICMPYHISLNLLLNLVKHSKTQALALAHTHTHTHTHKKNQICVHTNQISPFWYSLLHSRRVGYYANRKLWKKWKITVTFTLLYVCHTFYYVCGRNFLTFILKTCVFYYRENNTF